MSATPPKPASPSALQALAQQRAVWKRRHLRLARTDPNAFMEYVLRDEETGKRVQQAPHHIAWQALLSIHPRLVLLAHIESAKTSQVAVGRVLFELGRDPTLRIAILSNTHKQASRILKLIKQYIESSVALHEVFPNLKPGAQWTDSAITVERTTFAKDPSVQVVGVHGNVLGARTDLLVVDDILDLENTRTPDQRKQLWEWLQATMHTRLTERARVWVIGTPWHREDALHRYAESQAYKAIRYPVMDESGVPRWPERWPKPRIEAKRLELGPVEFARQMLCVPRDDESSRFKRDWLELSYQNGRNVPGVLSYGLKVVPPGYKTYTGIDLAVQLHAAAGLTVMFTLLLHPNFQREILEIQAGRWPAPEILKRIEDVHRRFQSLVFCENNQAQDYLVQMLASGTDIPIRGLTTGRNKLHPEFGIEKIATLMANGKYIFPCMDPDAPQGARYVHPEVQALEDEMLYYDPAGHTGDRLMALWMAERGIELGEIKAESGYINVTGR